MNYKKTVARAVILLNKTLSEKFGEKIGGEQIAVLKSKVEYTNLIFITYSSVYILCISELD